jgi:hypothetical protein
MMKNRIQIVVIALAASVVMGCTAFERRSSATGPSEAGNNSLLGSWTSSNLIPSPSTCTDFKWNVTEQTTTAAKGSFSASCAGDLKFTGAAEGTLASPTSISWRANGNATGPGLTSCVIVLTGTATMGTDSITVPYQGDTCLGKVSGVETLKKN